MSEKQMDAMAIADEVRSGKRSAVSFVNSALESARALNPALNGFTSITEERAILESKSMDTLVARGQDPGPLAGVPFAVKDLFDVEGITTLAGSKIDRDKPAATRDGTLVERMRLAGACLIGATNMDEYAYGFSTENSHYGPTRNPHGLAHIAGGSSGGSAAVVAADVVPVSLGSDTNGSIRVPSSLCGIFGLKPTYGRLSRGGSTPFCQSLDHVGPFARSTRDLALLLDVLSGPDPLDPACTTEIFEPALPELDKPWEGVRAGVLSGYFQKWSSPEARSAVAAVAKAIGAGNDVELPRVELARTAAYLITATEGANLHLPHLRTRPMDFDLATRDRFLAGALMPGAVYVQAQRFRSWFRREVGKILAETDILLTAATPITAPEIGQKFADFNGDRLNARQNMGLYTQPISFIGLPVVTVPVANVSRMPMGVMLIGAPNNEPLLLRAAHFLEKQGVAAAWDAGL
ncbi:MAG TPA: AtzE family amidohydrolase [Chthoniobacterales bacterium]